MTVSSTPSYSTTIQKPTVTMTIQMLPRGFDARQALQGAIQNGLKLQHATFAALARLQ
jgi:hypothetical protein